MVNTVDMATHTNTKHTCNSGHGPDFGRKTAGCPRCDELLAGAEPRAGWQKDYYAKKLSDDEQLARDIRNHKCANCGPVCTFGDW